VRAGDRRSADVRALLSGPSGSCRSAGRLVSVEPAGDPLHPPAPLLWGTGGRGRAPRRCRPRSPLSLSAPPTAALVCLPRPTATRMRASTATAGACNFITNVWTSDWAGCAARVRTARPVKVGCTGVKLLEGRADQVQGRSAVARVGVGPSTVGKYPHSRQFALVCFTLGHAALCRPTTSRPP